MHWRPEYSVKTNQTAIHEKKRKNLRLSSTYSERRRMEDVALSFVKLLHFSIPNLQLLDIAHKMIGCLNHKILSLAAGRGDRVEPQHLHANALGLRRPQLNCTCVGQGLWHHDVSGFWTVNWTWYRNLLMIFQDGLDTLSNKQMTKIIK
jgi:hypothetical protein